jgi:hypothetical protein
VAGLVAVLMTTAGRPTLVVGLGGYVIGVALAFVEARRAWVEQQPLTDFVAVRRTLLHDALHRS